MTEIFKVYKKTQRTVWEVSNYGRVKKNGEIYECKPNISGYLTFGGGYVHKIVAILFIPNPDNLPCVDHINTIKTDNRVENLKWVTHKQNCNNPLTIKHMAEAQKGKHTGENNGMYGRKGEKNPMYGKHFSEEHKNKISEAHKGKKHSEEACKKMSESHKGIQAGENHPMYGKHHTQEAKAKISKVHKGKTMSEEAKAKISESHKGEKSYMYGKPKSEEIKSKLSNAFKGRHIVLCSDGKRHWV